MQNVPLIMFPDGSLVRTPEIPDGGIIVVEPDEYQPPIDFVVDQTRAAIDSASKEVKPVRAKFDV
jgi:hypothetical protein